MIQCRMSNKPYDFFGTWYNDNYLLSGDLRWLAHLVSTSIVWLNRASQESDSEFTSIMNRMFKFYNRSASSIRSITVANCRSLPQNRPSSSSPTPSGASDDCASNKVFILDLYARTRKIVVSERILIDLYRAATRRGIQFHSRNMLKQRPRISVLLKMSSKKHVQRTFRFVILCSITCILIFSISS